MQRLTLRRFDVLRTANVVAVLYALFFALFGLIFLLPFALIGIAGTSQGGDVAGFAAAGIVGGLVFYLLLIAFYTFVGWIATIVLCAFYNFVAGRMGGIRFVVDVEQPGGGYPGYGGYPAVSAAPGYPAPTPNPYPPGYAPAPGPAWPGGAPPAPPA